MLLSKCEANDYCVQERDSGWMVFCNINFIKETGVSVEEKQEMEEVELIHFDEEGRVKREVARQEDQGVQYLGHHDCEEEDQWCKIVPRLLNFEAETEVLGRARKVDELQGKVNEGVGEHVKEIMEEKPMSSLEERHKIVHVYYQPSWTPFLAILGVFCGVMAGFVFITSLLIRKVYNYT